LLLSPVIRYCFEILLKLVYTKYFILFVIKLILAPLTA